MSFLSGLFSNPGASAASAANNRNGQVASTYAGLFKPAANDYGAILNSLGSMNLGTSIGNAVNYANQDPSKLIAQFGHAAQANAAQNAVQAGNAMKALGYGDGAAQGIAAGQFQNAANQTNQYAQQQLSPEGRLQALQAIFAALQGLQGSYGNIVSQLGAGVYGAPSPIVQQNPLTQIAGQAAGAYASAYGK